MVVTTVTAIVMNFTVTVRLIFVVVAVFVLGSANLSSLEESFGGPLGLM